jgi:hypothetical protein
VSFAAFAICYALASPACEQVSVKAEERQLPSGGLDAAFKLAG